MTEKNILNEEELEQVSGGFDFTFYDDTFTESTKVKELTDKYPWVVDLYPDLKTAATYNLTVGQACTIAGVQYEDLQNTLSGFEAKYNKDGTLK